MVLMHVLLFSCMVRKPSTSRHAQRVLDGRHGVMLVVLMHVLFVSCMVRKPSTSKHAQRMLDEKTRSDARGSHACLTFFLYGPQAIHI